MDYSATKRREMASKGTAMADGSFPIANTRDLANAIQALGRAKNRAAARKHIVARARALGVLKKLPDAWNVQEAGIGQFTERLHPRNRSGQWAFGAHHVDGGPQQHYLRRVESQGRVHSDESSLRSMGSSAGATHAAQAAHAVASAKNPDAVDVTKLPHHVRASKVTHHPADQNTRHERQSRTHHFADGSSLTVHAKRKAGGKDPYQRHHMDILPSARVREAAQFDPHLHPRDRRGKFRVGQRVVALGRGGSVIGMVPGSDRKAPHRVKVKLDGGETKTFEPDAVAHMAQDARSAPAGMGMVKDTLAQGVLPGLGVEGRISDVRARIGRLEQYRRYGEGYDRGIATHLHDAERFATPSRIDEAEHWIGRAEMARDAMLARRAERAAAKGPGVSLVPVVPKHEPKQLPPGPPPPPRSPDTSYGQRRHADRSDPIISRLLDAVGSRVRNVTIIPSSRLEMQGSDWSEGQRHQYTMVRLSDMKTVQMPRASEVHGNPFNYNVPAPEVDIPDGFAVVDQQVGYKPYVYVYANPAGLTPMLPDSALDEDMALVLTHTAALKNTYGGEKNIRFNRAKERFGMTLSRWVAAQEKARAKGYLNKAGAITPSGRNAVEGHPLRWKVH